MGQPLHNQKLYGTATVGTKGQIVIPAEAREEMKIEPGDRLYVVGNGVRGIVALLKEETLQEMVEVMTTQIENFQAIKNSNKE